jgi:hypothetical protein
MARRETSPYPVALLVAVLVGALGPRLVAPADRAAGGPFEYAPPEGFVPAGDQNAKILSGSVVGAQRAWVRPPANLALVPKYTPNVSLVHTDKAAPVEDVQLAALAAGMPALFAQSGTTWTEVRHTVHARPDGARVGIIEGAATKGDMKYRVLQIAFPEDSGASIVTASYPTEEAEKYGAAFEQSIDGAKGVAFRAPPPPASSYFVWGAAAGVLTLLAMGLRVRSAAVRAAGASERPGASR